MTRTRISRIASIVALLAATVQTASAQVAPGIVIAFDVPGSVPVGTWGVAAAALFIGLLAAYFLRSRKRAVSRMLAIGAVAIAATLSLNAERADAIVGPPTNLTVSPTTLTIGGAGTYTFINAAGNTIILRAITLTNPGSNTIDTLNTTCTVSRVLPVAQTCTVVVINNAA